MYIKSDYELDKVAREYAKDLWEEHEDFDIAKEAAFESVDSSEHVIYTARAISICGNCDTDAGEEWLEEAYGKPFNGCDTFAEVCTRLAFATLYTAVLTALDELEEELEE